MRSKKTEGEKSKTNSHSFVLKSLSQKPTEVAINSTAIFALLYFIAIDFHSLKTVFEFICVTIKNAVTINTETAFIL